MISPASPRSPPGNRSRKPNLEASCKTACGGHRPAPRHRSRMSCRNASEIMCGLFSALGEGRTPSQTAPVHGRGIRSPCAQTESPKEAADCFCDFAGLLRGKKVVCLFNDEEPGIGYAFRDDLQFCRWRSGIFSPGDREGRNNNPRQKLGDVGSFEHRANTLKDILCVWKLMIQSR